MKKYYQTLQLNDNLHCYLWQGRGNNCHTYLLANVLAGERPHALIDPGHTANEMGEACFDRLVEAMQNDGIKAEEIGLVLNTHSHPDHCEANEILVQKFGAPLIAISKEEDDFRRTTGEKLYDMLGMTAPKFEPFVYLGEGELKLGKAIFHCLLAPGHSPGSLCFYWPDKKILITGDVAFFGSIGRTDFPGGSVAALAQSIDKLAALDVEHLLPGHATEYGSIVKGADLVKRNFQALKMIF
ncbi:MAG: MBL fold metallo-hydrolase [Peptococcaceae bacterium]|nr:MAG: MBL fold metallo-hydrolase [Peptococcaceae bacterium]